MIDASTAAVVQEKQPKRADAVRNRARIIDAAFEVFGEYGIDAQMSDIAAAAELGIGTIYRNFASKEELVNALVTDWFAAVTRNVERLAREPSGWDALCKLMREVVEQQVENRVLSQFLSGQIAGSVELQRQRDALYERMAVVVDRATAEGALRDDVGVSDIRMILMSLSRVSVVDSVNARWLTMRHLGIILDGLRAPGRTPLVGEPLSIPESEEALRLPPAVAATFGRGSSARTGGPEPVRAIPERENR
jgi:AcrR family transcriptional regulator